MRKNSDKNAKSSKKTQPIYNLIHIATDNYLSAEDDEVNKQICSEILRSPDAPKIAAKLINKVINKSLSAHNHQSIWYSLLLLDTAIKNTDSKFCAAVLTKEFLNDLVKIVDPKYGVPEFVQEKLIYILKEWVLSLSTVTGYQNLTKYYKVIEFPPPAGQQPPGDMSKHNQRQPSIDSNFHQPTPNLNVSFKDKIVHDIDIIETNLSIFSDTVRSLNPESITNDELKFLEDLHETGVKMQERINEILPSIVWEDMIIQLIQVNDKILFTSERYKRFMSKKSQLILSSNRPRSKSVLEEVYDENSKPDSHFSNEMLTEIYATGSLPSYSEAVITQQKKREKDQEVNLISFDEEDSVNQAYKNKPLPSVPDNGFDSISMAETQASNSKSNENRLSSSEFDEFIELIARRHQQPMEPLEEIYDPPSYNAKISKPGKL